MSPEAKNEEWGADLLQWMDITSATIAPPHTRVSPKPSKYQHTKSSKSIIMLVIQPKSQSQNQLLSLKKHLRPRSFRPGLHGVAPQSRHQRRKPKLSKEIALGFGSPYFL